MGRDGSELAPRLFHSNQWQCRFLRLTTTSHLVNLLLREDHRSELGTAGEKQTCVGGSQWDVELIMRCIPACLVGPISREVFVTLLPEPLSPEIGILNSTVLRL